MGGSSFWFSPFQKENTVSSLYGYFTSLVASTINFLGGDAWYNVSVRNDTQYFSDIDYYGSKATSGVDFRAKNYDSIENLEKNSLDFYASVKSLYLQDRQQKILNSKKVINTQDDSDWEEIQN